MSKVRKKGLNPYFLVILSFIVVILIGSLLLVMPWAQKSGQWAFNHYIDCFFTAVSATCVTGLCSYGGGLAGTFTIGGQIVVLVMIQVGGLGFITILTFLITIFKSKLNFKNRYLLSQAVNSTNFADVVRFVRKIITISFIIETIGFLFGLPVFFTLFPNKPGDAIWNSLFTSVSAFNNAGFELFGNTSLVREAGTLIGDLYINHTWAYYYLLSYIMVLIVLGGISFLVIIEVFSFKKRPKQYRAFTKIVLLTSAFLLVFGFLAFYSFDGFKGSDSMSSFDAVFQSVTTRTAGFASYDQHNLSIGSQVATCILMFIGGSPLGTAGGVKTTTFFVIVIAMFSYLRGRNVTAFKRKYSTDMIVKAMSLVFIAFFVCIISYTIVIGIDGQALEAVEINGSAGYFDSQDVVFETFSAFGTVGLSTGVTPYLSVGSKLVLCVLMFLGRLGPMTFFQLFQRTIDKNVSDHFDLVEEDFLIG